MSDTRTPEVARDEAPTNEPLIVASGVTRILPGVVPTTLVHDIDLVIGTKEYVAITGPSGSGKSSLLYLLGLLDLPIRRRGAHPRPCHGAHGRGRACADAAIYAGLCVPVPLPIAGVLGA